MKFSWINVSGAVIVMLMLVPNIIYALRNNDERNLCTSRFMNVAEQTGRYACIILMWMPLLVWKFRFGSEFEMLLYLGGNGILLAAYWYLFARYMKKKSKALAILLAVIPSCIFLLSGVLLRHWLLAGFALLFAAGHIYVTYENAQKSLQQAEMEQP